MRMSRLRQSPPAQKLKKMLFMLGSRGPDSRWYGGYRLGQLIESMGKPFCENQLPAGYGRWIDERIVEYPWLFSRLPGGTGELLDAGSVLNHHFMIVHPKLRDKRITIMTLAPEPECYWMQGVSYVYGDLRKMIFRDNVFDYVVNISTLEHVGLDNQRFHKLPLEQKTQQTESYLLAVRELARVLKPGGYCFISVPFGTRVVQDWMQIFDAAMVERVIQEFSPESYTASYFRYSDECGWKACDKIAAADARYFNYQTDTPWPGHPAAAEAVVCLELKK
jgi:SAM-dependent methyltransferase